MKNLLTTILKTNEERIKNPFIGAFISSWIIINWKPIFYLIFASEDIENKIIFIEKNYSQISFILIYPALVALFYIIILPYLNLIFDEILKYSVLKKNAAIIAKKKRNIQDEKEVAIEEIRLEEAKTEFRERKTHNKLVENLQNQIQNLEKNLQEERENAANTNKRNKLEIQNLQKTLEKELSFQQKRMNEMREENLKLKEENYKKDELIETLSKEPEEEIGTTKLMFENGLQLGEFKNNGKVYYIDEKNKEVYTSEDVYKLKDEYSFDTITEYE